MASSSQPNLTKKVYPKRKNCGYPGCSNKIQNSGVCYKHGATPQICSHPCCSNNVVNNGVCRRHGAKGKKCGHEKCKNFAIKGGVCRRHGSVAKTCGHTGCTNNSKRFGVCRSHGAYRNQNPLQSAREDNPSSPDSSSNQLTRGTTTRHRAASTSNSQGEEVKSFASSHIEPSYIAIDHLNPPVKHFYNVLPSTIMYLGVENFNPLEFSEMSPTLQSLEHELSKILRDCGILSFD